MLKRNGNMKSNNDCSIIVIARDATMDMVRLTVKFWQIFWPNTQYNRFLCTESMPSGNFKELNNYFDDVFITGNHEFNYLQRVDFALKHVQSKYVILLLEDFFLNKPFSDKSIEEIINFADREKAGSIQLQKLKRFSKKYNEHFNIIYPDSLYRITTSPSLFNREYIMRFVKLNCTPWQFERKATKFSTQYPEPCFCCRKSIYSIVHACSEKKWFSKAIKLFKKCEIPEDLWNHKKQFPILKEWWLSFRWYILCIFPNVINTIQEKRSNRNERKINLC